VTFGKTVIFRFNHPKEAEELREKRKVNQIFYTLHFVGNNVFPVGKVAWKAVFLTNILSAELTITHSFRLFLAILPTGLRFIDVQKTFIYVWNNLFKKFVKIGILIQIFLLIISFLSFHLKCFLLFSLLVQNFAIWQVQVESSEAKVTYRRFEGNHLLLLSTCVIPNTLTMSTNMTSWRLKKKAF